MTAGTDEGQVLMTPNQPINRHATTGCCSNNNEGVTVIQLGPTHHRPQHALLQQLGPTRHRPQHALLQQVVIGIDGLRKLHLHLNFDQLQLEIEEDEWVEDGQGESNLAIDKS
eukprot:scaffold1284_cov108-Cylindrotheca_fusiformis.AAC.12